MNIAEVNKPFVIFFVGLIIGLGVGAFFLGAGTGISEKKAQEIVARLQKKGYVYEQGISGNSFQGTVKNIRGDQLTVLPSHPSVLDVILGREEIRTVFVGEADFKRYATLTLEDILEDMDVRSGAEGNSLTESLKYFNELEASPADVKEGSLIIVESKEEIGTRNQINASRILVLPEQLLKIPEGAVIIEDLIP